MHPKTHARSPRVLAGLILAAGLAGAAAYGQPAGQPAPKDKFADAKVDAKTGVLLVPVNSVVRFDPKLGKGALKSYSVNPVGVVDARTDITDPDVLLLFGTKTGGVKLTLTTKDDRQVMYDVIVFRDFDEEKAKLKASLIELNKLILTSFPTASVTATAEFTPAGGGIPITGVAPGTALQAGELPPPGYLLLLKGYVTSPTDAENIVRLVTGMLPGLTSAAGGNAGNNSSVTNVNVGWGAAAATPLAVENPYIINTIQVGGVQQVQIDVVIASVDRNEIRSRGFDFSVTGTTARFNSIVSGLLLPPAGGVGVAQVSNAANLQLGLAPPGLITALQALRTEGLTKFLAEPRVVTQTGRPASFRSGGRQATVGQSSGVSGAGSELVPFGTTLEVLPIVYGNGQIWMEIRPSVTSVNFGLGIVINGGATPGFTEQSASCSVMMESGQTYAIGGLIQNSVQSTATRVPVLGDVPYLGTLFSAVRHEERESELVILVTPRLVHAMDCNQVPRRLPGRETRTPDDYELFLEGILEAPRGQRKVWNGRCYNAAYKCDPNIATMPCAGNVCVGPNATGNCNATGCAVPSHTVAAGRPAAFPVPNAIPQTLPVNVQPMPEPMPAVLPPVPVSVPVPEASVPVVPATLPTAPVAPAAPVAPTAPPVEESPDAPPK